jgi:hypothetical protein
MQFLKRHYEKLLLSAVLAGLGAAVVWLSMAVAESKTQIPAEPGTPTAAKQWTAVDLAPFQNAVKSATNAPAFSLTGEHNLFNPVIWNRLSDGTLVKITRTGTSALAVTDIRPLYFTITLESQAGEGFYLSAKHASRPPVRWFARVGEKATAQKPYPIVGTNAAPENPSALTLQVQILATGEIVAVSSDAPYKVVEAYEADLRYEASDETNVFTGRHIADSLVLSGESHKIIAIDSNAVTVQNAGTGKKSDRQWSGGRGSP